MSEHVVTDWVWMKPGGSGRRVTVVLRRPAPRLTRWGKSVWTLNVRPSSVTLSCCSYTTTQRRWPASDVPPDSHNRLLVTKCCVDIAIRQRLCASNVNFGALSFYAVTDYCRRSVDSTDFAWDYTNELTDSKRTATTDCWTFLADRTAARSMIGYWHNTVVCLFVCGTAHCG